jgi:hypothetical protein
MVGSAAIFAIRYQRSSMVSLHPSWEQNFAPIQTQYWTLNHLVERGPRVVDIALSTSCGLTCGLEFSVSRRIAPCKRMAGTTRLEPAASAVTV